MQHVIQYGHDKALSIETIVSWPSSALGSWLGAHPQAQDLGAEWPPLSWRWAAPPSAPPVAAPPSAPPSLPPSLVAWELACQVLKAWPWQPGLCCHWHEDDAIDRNDPIGAVAMGPIALGGGGPAGAGGMDLPRRNLMASLWPNFPPQVSGPVQALLEVILGPGHTCQVVEKVLSQGSQVP